MAERRTRTLEIGDMAPEQDTSLLALGVVLVAGLLGCVLLFLVAS